MCPIIGITLDQEQSGSYSKLPWYAVRENYITPIANCGGIPVLLPYQCEYINDYLQFLSGIILTGGGFDIDPALYGQTISHHRIKLKPKRTEFEYALTAKALEQDMPILGICGGHQLLNVVFGGNLLQHIPEDNPQFLSHSQQPPFDQPGHEVSVIASSKLHNIVKTDTLAVNTEHHQAIDTIGSGLALNAIASDGIIEGIESSQHQFCLGVQWHLEYIVSEGDRRIFSAFIEACRS